MSRAEQVLGRVVASNNERIRRVDGGWPNPRPLQGVQWHTALVVQWPTFRDEWGDFVDAGHRLPLLDELLAEPQGASEPWRAGLLVAAGRAVPALADWFPRTIAAVLAVPGIRSGLWSVLEPGAVLHEHSGPNAGVLRYHLGIDCPLDAALQVGDTVVPYRDRGGVLFDDTEPHAAWNRGDRDRVTLFLEVLRPLPRGHGWRNAAVQAVITRDERYRGAVERAGKLDRDLNAGVALRRGATGSCDG